MNFNFSFPSLSSPRSERRVVALTAPSPFAAPCEGGGFRRVDSCRLRPIVAPMLRLTTLRLIG